MEKLFPAAPIWILSNNSHKIDKMQSIKIMIKKNIYHLKKNLKVIFTLSTINSTVVRLQKILRSQSGAERRVPGNNFDIQDEHVN